jgi:hypothetical protein
MDKTQRKVGALQGAIVGNIEKGVLGIPPFDVLVVPDLRTNDVDRP